LDLKVSAFYSTLLRWPSLRAVCAAGAINDALSRAYGKRVGRCGVAFVALLLAAVFLWWVHARQAPRLAGIVLSGGAGALYLSQSSYWVGDRGYRRGKRGGGIRIHEHGGQFGGALTASLTPAIAQQYGWTPHFWLRRY